MGVCVDEAGRVGGERRLGREWQLGEGSELELRRVEVERTEDGAVVVGAGSGLTCLATEVTQQNRLLRLGVEGRPGHRID